MLSPEHFNNVTISNIGDKLFPEHVLNVIIMFVYLHYFNVEYEHCNNISISNIGFKLFPKR